MSAVEINSSKTTGPLVSVRMTVVIDAELEPSERVDEGWHTYVSGTYLGLVSPFVSILHPERGETWCITVPGADVPIERRRYPSRDRAVSELVRYAVHSGRVTVR